MLFVGHEMVTRRAEELEGMADPMAARELASLRIRVADSADIARIESKLDRLLASLDDQP